MSALDHRKGREENQRAIEERLRRLNHEVGGGVLTEQQIRERAKRDAERAAQTAVRDEERSK